MSGSRGANCLGAAIVVNGAANLAGFQPGIAGIEINRGARPAAPDDAFIEPGGLGIFAFLIEVVGWANRRKPRRKWQEPLRPRPRPPPAAAAGHADTCSTFLRGPRLSRILCNPASADLTFGISEASAWDVCSRRVAVLIAGMENSRKSSRPAGSNPCLVQHGFGDGGRRKVQALAQLLPQQPKNSRVEIVRVVYCRRAGNPGRLLAHQARHVAAAAQPGAGGQVVLRRRHTSAPSHTSGGSA